MFTYELTYAIKRTYRTFDIKEASYVLVLIPEMVEDIISKINKLSIKVPQNINYTPDMEFGVFKNGYAFIENKRKGHYRILNKYGEFFEIDGSNVEYKDGNNQEYFAYSDVTDVWGGIHPQVKDIAVCGYFYEDRALCQYNRRGDQYSLGYIDGISHKFLPIPTELEVYSSSPFMDGYAQIGVSPNRRLYIDKEMHVQVSYGKNKELDRLFRTKKPHMAETIKRIPTEEKDHYIYIDEETGMNILSYGVIKEIASYFKLKVPDMDVKKQLLWLLGEIAQKGNYIFRLKHYDEKRGAPRFEKLKDGELVTAIRVSDGKNSIFSCDEEDLALVRERIKKGSE